MRAIINKGQPFGTLNGVITPSEQILKLVNNNLKQGTAKLLIDSDTTLMYSIKVNNMKP